MTELPCAVDLSDGAQEVNEPSSHPAFVVAGDLPDEATASRATTGGGIVDPLKECTYILQASTRADELILIDPKGEAIVLGILAELKA